MKKLFSMLMLVLVAFSSYAGQKPSVHPGARGIFIFCGDSLPKGFHYLVEKQGPGGNWEKIALLNFPSGFQEFRARIINGEKAGIAYSVPSEKELSVLWESLKTSKTLRVLGEKSVSPPFVMAAGCGFWDVSAKERQRYIYRLTLADTKDQPILQEVFRDISFPGVTPDFGIQYTGSEPATLAISLSYIIARPENMAGLRVLRRPYALSDFKEIDPVITYRNENGKKVMQVTDEAVHDKAQYSYKIIPFDHFGNEGKEVETADVYNVTKYSLSASIASFKAASKDMQNAIQLTWDLQDGSGVVSQDIYRGTDYDGYFIRIASVSGKERAYSDPMVKPGITYYYSIVASTAYGRTFPSSRIQGRLLAERANLLPPRNLQAERRGNTVSLQWERSDDDPRAYYVYRSLSYLETPVQVSPALFSKEKMISWTDSLKDITATEAVLVYAVADENASYLRSPLSEKVAVPGPVRTLPIPWPIESRLAETSVTLFWQDYFPDYQGLASFRVFRKCVDLDDKPVEDWKMVFDNPLAFGMNSWTDHNLKEGYRYYYSLEAIGIDGSTGSRSPEVSVFIEENLPQTPANLRAMATTGGILLQWDAVLSETVDAFIIYRADADHPKQVISTQPATADAFTDTEILPNTTYFYYIFTQDQRSRQCRNAASVGIRSK